MERGLTIRAIWDDDDMLELEVACWNGRFAGSTEIYDSHDALDILADKIAGFPTSSNDRRTVELGTLDRGDLGGARLTFQCIDGTGHSALRVELISSSRDETKGSASLAFPFEPAALDDFVTVLRGLKSRWNAEAHLPEAQPRRLLALLAKGFE